MFQTTHWSLVRASGLGDAQARVALSALCSAYREPVLAYIRRQPRFRAQAEDLTQAFFLEFLQAHVHAAADPLRGRFRSFLLGAVRHFLSHQLARDAALKRGGGAGIATLDEDSLGADGEDSPERAFERAWAQAVLRRALGRLEAEAHAAGKEALHAAAAEFLLEPPDRARYAAVAAGLGMRPNTFAVAVHRMRQRLRAMVEAELADTVGGPEELDAERRHLQRELSR